MAENPCLLADEPHARLQQPVLDLRQGGTWSVDVQMQGQLDHWLPRLRTWLDLPAGIAPPEVTIPSIPSPVIPTQASPNAAAGRRRP